MNIGLTGAAGSGKDSVGGVLVEDFGYTRIGFADRLYEEAALAYNVPLKFLQKRETKETETGMLSLCHCDDMAFVDLIAGQHPEILPWTPLSPRFVLQNWGTEYRRAQNNSYWIDSVKQFMDECSTPVVITDVRFVNEASVLGLGNQLWKVVRPSIKIQLSSHISEEPIDEKYIDQLIINNGTLEELKERVHRMMEQVSGAVY